MKKPPPGIPKGAVHEMLVDAIRQPSAVHIPTVLLGGGALLAGFGLRRWAPKLPAPMILVAATTVAAMSREVASYFMNFGERWLLALVGGAILVADLWVVFEGVRLLRRRSEKPTS